MIVSFFKQKKGLFVIIGVCLIVLLSCAVIHFYFKFRKPVFFALDQYVTVIQTESNEVKAEIDRDALLADLHLPNKFSVADKAASLPEVEAILSIQLFLSPTSIPAIVQVVALADTNTLAQHGLYLEALKWEQPVIKSATLHPVSSVSDPISGSDQATAHADSDAYLSSLIDSNGYGYNLRSVCERVQHERDLFCHEQLGESYKTEKLQISFSANAKSSPYHNIYQVCYRATPETENGEPQMPVFFRICLYNLQFGDDGSIIFDTAVNCSAFDTDTECKALPSAAEYETTVLYGGGQRVSNNPVFDQNGFVIFPDQPTSYRMATGLYWSPTYDMLTEDMIWKLTASDTYSLAKILRYARKEIYARYHVSFDQKTELEFFNHYRSYPWYCNSELDQSEKMTETERANMRLLREIQSLIEK